MVKHVFFVFVMVALVSIAKPIPAIANPNHAQDEPTLPPDITDALQRVMDLQTGKLEPPGMVLWIDTPKVRFAGVSGLADLGMETPMPPDGGFRIASITKMFTAVIVLQLAEEDVLTLDDHLADWLPDIAVK
jgi:CubicO group peptidase (beta-lactamase class C family)